MSQLSVDTVTAKTTNTDLTLNGNGTGIVVLPAGVAGFSSVQVFTSSGTWNKPSGINKVIVIFGDRDWETQQFLYHYH